MAIADNSYTYYSNIPVINSLSSHSSDVSGGLIVTITGNMFGNRTNNSNIQVVGVNVRNILFWNNNAITFEVPSSPRTGKGFVIIRNKFLQYNQKNSVAIFEYYAKKPVIKKIMPHHVSSVGGKMVTIQGDKFYDRGSQSKVLIAGRDLAIISWTNKIIKVKTSRLLVDYTSVKVVNKFGHATKVKRGIIVFAKKTIKKIKYSGQKTVTIKRNKVKRLYFKPIATQNFLDLIEYTFSKESLIKKYNLFSRGSTNKKKSIKIVAGKKKGVTKLYVNPSRGRGIKTLILRIRII
jgi:hypothetical protein